MGWLRGWWSVVVERMWGGVVERMVEWGDWVDGGVGWLRGWWSGVVEWRMVEWGG